MSTNFVKSFLAHSRDAGNVVLSALAAGIAWLPEASLLRIAMMCLALAFFISILPLALTLFMLMLVVKLVAAALLVKPEPLALESHPKPD